MAFGALQLYLVFTTIGVWTLTVTGGSGGGGGGGGGAGGGGGGGGGGGTARVGGEGTLSMVVWDPEDVTVGRGKAATLRCPIHNITTTTASVTTSRSSSNRQQPIITWLYNHTQIIQPNDTRREVHDDGSLFIHKVSAGGGKPNRSLDGLYTCLVRNHVGTLRTGAAHLRTAMLAKQFNEQPPENTTVTQFQPVVFRCRIHSVPQASIHWLRDGAVLPHHNRYVPLPSGDLLITSVDLSDAGSYICIALNTVLKKTRKSDAARLWVVAQHPGPQGPTPLTIYTNLTFKPHSGTQVRLYCVASGFPVPTISWTHNKQIVSNTSVLRIDNITTTSSGIYNCTASNPSGTITQMYDVKVVEKPYFVETPKSLWFPSARAVRIVCKAKGTPPPQVTWLKDGAPLQLNERIRWSNNTLSFSHTYTTDQGMYQCVAENEVGRIWSAAQLTVNRSEDMPRPPVNLRCYSYNTSSICLQWDPPANVYVKAYTIHSPDIELYVNSLTNNTHFFMSGLKSNKSYVFYVRAYTSAASDSSSTITCQTAASGDRGLRIEPVGLRSIRVHWSTLHSDMCGGGGAYKLQWRRLNHPSNNAHTVTENHYIITNLIPSETYEIRVQTSTNEDDELPWTIYTMSGNELNATVTSNEDDEFETSSEGDDDGRTVPTYLEAEALSPHSVNLTWTDTRKSSEHNAGYYMICYGEVRLPHDCDTINNNNNKFEKSTSTSIVINGLNPFTQYQFQVRYHSLDGHYGHFSHAVELRTLEHVPEAVSGLVAKPVNETTVCLRWMVPRSNGHLLKYVVSYSTRNVSLERWPRLEVGAARATAHSCLRASSDAASTLLAGLQPGTKYVIAVRAATRIGLGRPSKFIHVETPVSAPTTPTRAPSLPHTPTSHNHLNHKPELGIIVGMSIALVCIIGCISCMIFRRRCLKARALERGRGSAGRASDSGATAGAVTHAAAAAAALDPCRAVTTDRRCTVEAHELHCLVPTENIPINTTIRSGIAAPINTTMLPPAAPHIDTKGGVGYPNGQLNGLKYIANGHIPNGSVHITENPQYEQYECNGNYTSSECRRLLSPVRCHDGASPPCLDERVDAAAVDDDDDDDDDDDNQNNETEPLNVTQLTSLDESLRSMMRDAPAPVLGPNG